MNSSNVLITKQLRKCLTQISTHTKGKSKILPKLADITSGDLEDAIVELTPSIEECLERQAELRSFYNEDRAKLMTNIQLENWSTVGELAHSLAMIKEVLSPIELALKYIKPDHITAHCNQCDSQDLYTNFNNSCTAKCIHCSKEKGLCGFYIKHNEEKLPLLALVYELVEKGYQVNELTQAVMAEPEPYLSWNTEFNYVQPQQQVTQALFLFLIKLS